MTAAHDDLTWAQRVGRQCPVDTSTIAPPVVNDSVTGVLGHSRSCQRQQPSWMLHRTSGSRQRWLCTEGLFTNLYDMWQVCDCLSQQHGIVEDVAQLICECALHFHYVRKDGSRQEVDETDFLRLVACQAMHFVMGGRFMLDSALQSRPNLYHSVYCTREDDSLGFSYEAAWRLSSHTLPTSLMWYRTELYDSEDQTSLWLKHNAYMGGTKARRTTPARIRKEIDFYPYHSPYAAVSSWPHAIDDRVVVQYMRKHDHRECKQATGNATCMSGVCTFNVMTYVIGDPTFYCDASNRSFDTW